MFHDHNTPWKLTALVALVVIVLTIPASYLRQKAEVSKEADEASRPQAAFVGSEACRDCHRPEYDKWIDSHHRWAMATATEKTVLGDFDDAVYEHFGNPSRFYRRDGKFYVHTRGIDGEPGEFEVTHTFGWYPLQQYLVPFPGGRLQCLPLAWDVEQKRWYHLYPDAPLEPSDWLYWTNNSQNWNGMCAECHSTDLKKNYDHRTDTYATTWSEISVGCEACHGPGSAHVAWAQLPEMGRPEVANAALSVKTGDLSAREQIELCAPCHSRRMSLNDNIHSHEDFLDYGIPQLLSEGLYFADGQILDEVYVYGSFMQSKMYARGVRCSDCHDVHSIRRIEEGNALCLQCHKAAVYDQKRHHFHKKAGEPGEPVRSEAGDILFDVGSGAQCEGCHMPGRHYMGIDYRPDHSFRLPRPDLTLDMGTPNACDRCHVNKPTQWSVEAMAKWYGEARRPHYGQIINAGREGRPEAADALSALAVDRLYPTIVRATALALLAEYGGETVESALAAALSDEASLVRQTAVRHLPQTDPGRRRQLLAPLLYDPVRGVRIEAAGAVAALSPDTLPPDAKRQFERALAEYRRAMERTADFAASRHNLGNLAQNLGQVQDAIDNYRKAIAIDDQFYPAKVNLAMLYNQRGENEAAESLLREVLARHPDFHQIHYSLGLLLAERNRWEEAAVHLKAAAAGLPDQPRIHYNLGLLLQKIGGDAEAEAALQQALAIAPHNPEFQYALAVFYVESRQWERAGQVAAEFARDHPELPEARRLVEIISTQRKHAQPVPSP